MQIELPVGQQADKKMVPGLASNHLQMILIQWERGRVLLIGNVTELSAAGSHAVLIEVRFPLISTELVGGAHGFFTIVGRFSATYNQIA